MGSVHGLLLLQDGPLLLCCVPHAGWGGGGEEESVLCVGQLCVGGSHQHPRDGTSVTVVAAPSLHPSQIQLPL